MVEVQTIPAAADTQRPGSAERPRIAPALADHLGFLLAQAHLLSVSVADRALAPLQLEIKQYVALAILASDRHLSQHQLGERMRIDRTTMVALVDTLETNDDVVRHRNPEDRRAYALQITRHGRATLARAKRAVSTAEQEISADLSDSELRHLKDLLTRLLAA